MLYMSSGEMPADLAGTRVSSFEMPLALLDEGSVLVELTLDTSPDATVLMRLAWTLFACAVAGTSIVSVGAFWLVRRALAPVRQLAQQTRELGASRLSDRLDGSAQADELQPLVDQFNALLDRLEQSYNQMEAFNADVAHELRTPLTTLIGECELALDEGVGLAQAREVLGSNLEELHRIAEIVNAMLFLSQAARGAKHAGPRSTAWPWSPRAWWSFMTRRCRTPVWRRR
jgi:two-component system heavy metal sensor histidine kinase CusS